MKKEKSTNTLENTEQNTNLQLTFDVFKELGSQSISIERSKKEIGFRKNNLLITVANLTLDQKRVLDVIFFIAAQGVESSALHAEYIQKTEQGLYVVDLSFFKWLTSLTNPRNARLRDIMRSIQGVSLQAEEFSQANDSEGELEMWQSHNFFGSAYINVPKNKAAFSINPIFEQHIQKPKSFHFLSLRHVLPNLASKILYDWLMLLSNRNQPFTISFKQLLIELGQKNKKSYRSFGAFNRAFLNPAIDGVNSKTNLHIDVILLRKGKSAAQVTHLTFTVQERSPEKNDYDEFHQFVAQYKTLRDDFGLQNAHIEEILQNRDEWTDERIERAKTYTLARLQRGGVKSVSAYFMNALREGYHIGKLELEMIRGDTAHLDQLIDSEGQVPELRPTKRSNDVEKQINSQIGWKSYEAMQANDKLETVDTFCLNAYIELVASAAGVNVTDKVEMMQAIYQNERLKMEFGLFVFKITQTTHG